MVHCTRLAYHLISSRVGGRHGGDETHGRWCRRGAARLRARAPGTHPRGACRVHGAPAQGRRLPARARDDARGVRQRRAPRRERRLGLRRRERSRRGGHRAGPYRRRLQADEQRLARFLRRAARQGQGSFPQAAQEGGEGGGRKRDRVRDGCRHARAGLRHSPGLFRRCGDLRAFAHGGGGKRPQASCGRRHADRERDPRHPRAGRALRAVHARLEHGRSRRLEPRVRRGQHPRAVAARFRNGRRAGRCSAGSGQSFRKAIHDLVCLGGLLSRNRVRLSGRHALPRGRLRGLPVLRHGGQTRAVPLRVRPVLHRVRARRR